MSFHSIPTLDLALARSSETKLAFLKDLRHALLEVGFLYIKNTGIDEQLIRDVISEGKGFFDLPVEKKLEMEMKNAASFLGRPSRTPIFAFICVPRKFFVSIREEPDKAHKDKQEGD